MSLVIGKPAPRPDHLARLGRSVGLALVASVLFGGAYVLSSSLAAGWRSGSYQAAPPLSSDVAAGAVSPTDRTIGMLQEQLRQAPGDQRSQTRLGLAYLQKAREVADPAFYTRADGLLNEALVQAPGDADTLVGVGTLALARHQFDAGLRWGQQAVAADPYKAAAYGVVADAYTELGQYDQAVDAVQRMVDLRPDQTSFARVAYQRELHGDLAGAATAMRQAVDTGLPGAEGTEWSRVQLGDLAYRRGDLAAAETQYRASLRVLPDYVYAREGLARVAAARGGLDTAIQVLADVTRQLPVPQFVMELAEAQRAAGQTDAAAQSEQLVRVEAQLYQANGVDTDLELALFEADHGDAVRAVSDARAEWARRQSIHAADALGWALYRAGQCSEADTYAQQALRLGTQDALLRYHAAAIAACVGDAPRARTLVTQALDTNPHFSIALAPEAARLRARLSAEP